MIEKALAEVFTAQVQAPPVLDDPAGMAIRRARRIRRRRAALGSMATMVAVVAFGSGLVWVQGLRTGDSAALQHPATPPAATDADDLPVPTTPAPAVGGLPAVDLVVGGVIWTADGRRIPVSREAGQEIDQVLRVPFGWLVDLGAAVRLVNDAGKVVPLPVGPAWAVSADGERLAYSANRRLVVAKLADTGLTTLASADVAAGTVPVTFAGERLVLGATGTTGQIEGYGQWSGGTYSPQWTQGLLDVYGTAGGELVGLVPGHGGGAACLARVATATGTLHTADPAACGLVLTGHQTSSRISPDGRWLAVAGTDAVFFYDLTTVFTQQRAAAACPMPDVQDLVWETPQQVLAADGSQAVRCGTDGGVERVTLPPGLPAGWQFVPSRASAKGA